jgi:ribosomal subunit interface protein
MVITISGKHIEIGENLRSFITSEITSVSHYVGEFIDAHALIKKPRHLFYCEIDVHVARGFNLRSSGKDSDPYACVAQAITILKQRTKRYRARLRGMERHRKNEDSSLSRFIIAEAHEEVSVLDAPLIMAERTEAVHEISVGDAVMRLDLSEVPILVFRNTATGAINIVYRVHNSDVGWIVLEKCVC